MKLIQFSWINCVFWMHWNGVKLALDGLWQMWMCMKSAQFHWNAPTTTATIAAAPHHPKIKHSAYLRRYTELPLVSADSILKKKTIYTTEFSHTQSKSTFVYTHIYLYRYPFSLTPKVITHGNSVVWWLWVSNSIIRCSFCILSS